MELKKVLIGLEGLKAKGNLDVEINNLDSNSKNIKETMEGLKKSSGFIRSELARSVNLRNTPEIIFELDDSIEYGARIDSILDKIMKDVKKSNENEEE